MGRSYPNTPFYTMRTISGRNISTGSSAGLIHLCDLLPSADEIDAGVKCFSDPADFRLAFRRLQKNKTWQALDAPASTLFPWDDNSAYLRHPPFASAQMASRLGTYSAYPLLVLGDDMTTDHIGRRVARRARRPGSKLRAHPSHEPNPHGRASHCDRYCHPAIHRPAG